MNCIFAYNPNSGKAKSKRVIRVITRRLVAAFDSVRILETDAPGDMTRFARDACGQCDVFAFLGGDGTFHEVINGLAEQPNRPRLLYIPGGTVNDIARTFRIPRKPLRAVRALTRSDKTAKYDIFRVNEGYAAYVICSGLFQSSSYATPQERKRVLGRVAYFLDGMKVKFEDESFHVKLTAGDKVFETETPFIALLNSKSVAGFRINQDASMTDGKADCVVVRTIRNSQSWIRAIGSIFSVARLFIVGVREIDDVSPNTFIFREGSFRIETSDDVRWGFDGEYGESGNLDITILQQHIELIVPSR